MKKKQLPLMIMTTLLLGIHSFGTVEAAQVAGKSGTKPVVAKSSTTVSGKAPVKAVRGTVGKSTFKPLVTKPVPKVTASTTNKPRVTAPIAVKPKVTASTTVKTKVTAPSSVKPNATTVASTKPKVATTTVKPKVTASATTSRATAAVVTKNQVEQATTRVRVENTPDVRVLLGSRRQDASVSSANGVTVLTSNNGKVGSHKVVSVGVRGSKIAVNGKALDSVVTLKPTSGDIFTFEGKAYRGALTLRANNGAMMVINAVPLESYLYGVVPQEAIPSWPAAALEAQAVAARTYALHTMDQNKNQLYDVSTSTDHQVYGGVSGETQSTTAAVNHTKGIVMLYNNRPINALFHSDGGGYTEDSVNVWGNDIPYLKGVKDFSNSNSSASNWTVSTSRSALEGKLNAASKGVGKLKSIQLTPLGNPGKATADRGVSGRIKSATFVGTAGKVTVSGDDLRGMLGLKSTLFDFYINQNPASSTSKSYHTFTGKNDTVYIKGHGWGHGLGMSQWGAAEMAKRAGTGDTNYYQTILRHYYSGITLKKMY